MTRAAANTNDVLLRAFTANTATPATNSTIAVPEATSGPLTPPAWVILLRRLDGGRRFVIGR